MANSTHCSEYSEAKCAWPTHVGWDLRYVILLNTQQSCKDSYFFLQGRTLYLRKLKFKAVLNFTLPKLLYLDLVVPSMSAISTLGAQSCLISLGLHGLLPTRLLCPWGFPDKTTGVGCHFLLRGIFLTQRSNLRPPHWQVDPLPVRNLGNSISTLAKALSAVLIYSAFSGLASVLPVIYLEE